MYVRFVIPAVDDDSGRRQGVFKVAYALRRSGELHPHLQEQFEEALSWFDEHLDVPERFSRSDRRHARGMAIGWFKDSAKDCLRQMHTICRILNEHGVATEMLKSNRPGYIVFEDRLQIAAVPFSDTAT